MSLPAIPPSPAAPGDPGPDRIPLRKVILAVVLAGAILLFFLIVLAGTVAVLREGAPGGHVAGSSVLLTLKRVIVRHFHPAAHHH